ncbi:hypothetical protein [Streptomyces sp. NPDC002588]|uniref:hypothetical protein n=1 Tax=Streptomyces sp. NPDC002588 TaxID=3154419 RepID=UPI003321F472
MSDTSLARSGQDASVTELLVKLTAALARELAAGAWCPGPLERSLARRLLTASAGDHELTADRVREVIREGAVAVFYVGEGRLAALLGQLAAVAEAPEAPEAGATDAGAGARSLLERIAYGENEEGGHDGDLYRPPAGCRPTDGDRSGT